MGIHPMFIRLSSGRAIAVRLAMLAGLWLTLAAHASDAEWQSFKRTFVDEQGRVIDNGHGGNGHGGISHSEGQGFAMLLATHHGDREGFAVLWRWTQRHLQVRADRLFAWRWHPAQGVTDRNNASDADLLIAWALLRAGEKWSEPSYLEHAAGIARDIRARLLRRTAHGLILLPAIDGFDNPDGARINLSYWIFPALREMGRIDPAGEWAELEASGLELLRYAKFGRWGLPPDWLRLAEKVAPAPGFPERFGYDAVRIPLYLLWSGQGSDALMQPYRQFWSHFAGARFLPAWTNLKDDSIDGHGAPPGIRSLAQWVLEGDAVSLPAADASAHYYSAVLLLLCKMAIAERRIR